MERGSSKPYNWVQDFYLPALKAHGITGKDEIMAQMGSDFQNKLAGQAVGNWATQQSRYGKDLALIKKASDETAEMYQRTDPMTAWKGVKESLISAAGTMGEGFTKSLAAPMNDLSKAISGYTDRLTGFMGKHPGIGSFIEEHPVGALTGLGAAGMTGVLGALWAGSRMYRAGAVAGDAAVTALGGASRYGLAFAAPALGPVATVAALAYPSSIGPEDEITRQRRYSTIPGAFTPLPSGTFAPGPVTAKLDGQASINVAVSIDAPPELLALMRSNVTTTAFGDVRPDTGVSMPESSPSQGGRNGVWR